MMMSYLPDIDASMSSLKAFKVRVSTLKGELAPHATLKSDNLLAGFFFHVKKSYFLDTSLRHLKGTFNRCDHRGTAKVLKA